MEKKPNARERNRKKYRRLVPAIEARTGRRVALSTALRWAQKGCGGVILESWMIGGLRCTTVEAVDQFIAKRTEATTPATVDQPRSPSRRDRDLARAEDQLSEALDQ